MALVEVGVQGAFLEMVPRGRQRKQSRQREESYCGACPVTDTTATPSDTVTPDPIWPSPLHVSRYVQEIGHACSYH